MKNVAIAILTLLPLLAYSNNKCNSPGKAFPACKSEVESNVISSIGNLAQRNGDTLILKPLEKRNPNKVLVNSEEVTYTVEAHYPEQSLTLISEDAWENFNAHAYHHKYGAYIEVFDKVTFSPSNEYMVAFGADIEAGFSPNAVAIYRLGDWPELLVKYENMSFGVSDALFLSDNKVELRIFYFKEGVNGYAKSTCHLTKSDDLWQFEDIDCTKTSSLGSN